MCPKPLGAEINEKKNTQILSLDKDHYFIYYSVVQLMNCMMVHRKREG